MTIAYTGCGGNAAAPETSGNANVSNTVTAPANTDVSSNGGKMQPIDTVETREVANNLPVPVNANVMVVNSEQLKPETNEMPAPDNSTFSTEMNSKGQPVETRTFKSHPVVAKIEKITMNSRDYVFKIYLKNGKVVESKSEKLKDFRVIAPANILDAIGMLPAPSPKVAPDPNNPENQKKPVLIPRANP